jgi:molybdate transport system substrate-binding protein
MKKARLRWNAFVVAGMALFCGGLAVAAWAVPDNVEIKVVTSGTFTPPYQQLVPEYERLTHNKIVTEFGGSTGSSPSTITNRLGRGEVIDVVIMSAPALDEMIGQGKVRKGSRVDLVKSKIAMVVKAGAPKPDISSVDALKRAVLAAKSIALSESASGIYLSSELFPKMGIADQVKGKIVTTGAGAVVAGKAEIGFQQLSELRTVQGVDVVGELPPGAQQLTIFSAGVPTTATHPAEAKAFIEWLASPAGYAAIEKAGLEPAAKTK